MNNFNIFSVFKNGFKICDKARVYFNSGKILNPGRDQVCKHTRAGADLYDGIAGSKLRAGNNILRNFFINQKILPELCFFHKWNYILLADLSQFKRIIPRRRKRMAVRSLMRATFFSKKRKNPEEVVPNTVKMKIIASGRMNIML